VAVARKKGNNDNGRNRKGKVLGNFPCGQ